jgi:hypothetical protein
MCISQYNILFLKTKSLKLRRENGSLFRSGVDKTPFWKAACVITLSSGKYSFQHESETYMCISRCNSILLKTTPFYLRREKGSCSGVVLIRHPFTKQYPITKPPLNIQTAASEIGYIEMHAFKEERPLSFGCVVLYFGRYMMALGNMAEAARHS